MAKNKKLESGSLENDSGRSSEYEKLWKEKLNVRTQQQETVAEAEEAAPEEEPQHEPESKGVLNKEMTIKFHPGSAMKWGGIVLLFIVVFFIGRISVGGPADTSSDADVSGTLGSFFGLFSGDDAGEDTADIVESSSDTITAAAVTDSDTAEEPTGDEDDSADESVVTTYDGVSFTIGDLRTEWKGTWGRIKSIQYTIKNMEAGTVEPDYFLLIVEGYDDLEKKIPLPPGSTSVKSKTSASSSALIPGGFSYSETTAGDLSSVGITLQLYDATGKLMAAANKMADLEG